MLSLLFMLPFCIYTNNFIPLIFSGVIELSSLFVLVVIGGRSVEWL